MQPGMMAHSWNPTFRRLKQEEYCEFKASLVARNKQNKAAVWGSIGVN